MAEPDYNVKRYAANRDYHCHKAREWYQKNKKRHQEYGQQWRRLNAKKIKKNNQEYYTQNRQKYVENSRRWRRENCEQYRAYNQQWTEENPEKAIAMRRAIDSRRRARERKLPNNFTADDWLVCLEYWGYTCAVCGKCEVLDADHWIPLANDDCPGTVVENIICLCEHCNSTKHAKYPDDWLIEKLGRQIGHQKLMAINSYFDFIKTLKV